MKKSTKRILSEGKKYKAAAFNIYYVPSSIYKTGFIARHGTGRPAGRNYSKRIIREYFKNRFKSGDFVFVIKKTARNNQERPLFRETLIKELKKASDFIECKKQ